MVKCTLGHPFNPNLGQLTKAQMDYVVVAAIKRSPSLVVRKQVDYYVKLAWKESKWRPQAKNRRSSAYGLFQFLNSTWRTVGVKKTACYHCQTSAALRYVGTRYGTAEKAFKHHTSRGWY